MNAGLKQTKSRLFRGSALPGHELIGSCLRTGLIAVFILPIAAAGQAEDRQPSGSNPLNQSIFQTGSPVAPIRPQGGVTGWTQESAPWVTSGRPPWSPTGMTDVYGNAQFDRPERRPLSLSGIEAEFDPIGGPSSLVSQSRQRGGPMAFALPGEILGLSTMQTFSESVSPSVSADVTRDRQRAMAQYGGFGTRGQPYGLEDGVTSAFARRQRLIEASSENAPIYRSMIRNNAFSGLRSSTIPSVMSAPGMDAPARPVDSTEYAASLHEILRTNVRRDHTKSKADAWDHFEEGEYRRAARTFEAALVLDPDDVELRIGEIFSYLAGDGPSTATVLVQQLDRRAPNLFHHDAGIKERYERAGLLEKHLREARLRVESVEGERNPNLLAMHIFVLWHLGDRETALRAAQALAREPDGSAFASWPLKMRDARSALIREPGR